MHCLPILALGLLLSAPPAEDVRRATRDVFRDRDIQAQFPGVDPSAFQRTPAERSPEGDHPLASARDPAAATVNVLMWVLIGAAILIAALYLAQRFGGYTADLEAAGRAQGVAGGGGARAPPDADEARRLAAEGHYEEAIHLLLLLALHPLAQDLHLAGSLTSREIVRSVELPEAARAAIHGLVRAVEISVFGGEAPARADFDACADCFERYAAAYGAERA